MFRESSAGLGVFESKCPGASPTLREGHLCVAPTAVSTLLVPTPGADNSHSSTQACHYQAVLGHDCVCRQTLPEAGVWLYTAIVDDLWQRLCWLGHAHVSG